MQSVRPMKHAGKSTRWRKSRPLPRHNQSPQQPLPPPWPQQLSPPLSSSTSTSTSTQPQDAALNKDEAGVVGVVGVEVEAKQHLPPPVNPDHTATPMVARSPDNVVTIQLAATHRASITSGMRRLITKWAARWHYRSMGI